MNKAAVIGVLLLLGIIPLGQLWLSNYQQFTTYQEQAELEKIQCPNSACSGVGMAPFLGQQFFNASMSYLLAALLIGGVGVVLVGLNRKELLNY